jgi:hypothetical protein
MLPSQELRRSDAARALNAVAVVKYIVRCVPVATDSRTAQRPDFGQNATVVNGFSD